MNLHGLLSTFFGELHHNNLLIVHREITPKTVTPENSKQIKKFEHKTSPEFPHGSATAVLFSSSHTHRAMEIKRLTLSTPSLTNQAPHHESSFQPPLYYTAASF